jgi:DNA-binding transcriptional ArsR family regulator
MPMDPSELRGRILRELDKHERTGSSEYLDDTKLAEAIGVERSDIQRQLDILKHRDQVDVAKTMGPSYAARLTAAGMEAVEGLD